MSVCIDTEYVPFCCQSSINPLENNSGDDVTSLIERMEADRQNEKNAMFSMDHRVSGLGGRCAFSSRLPPVTSGLSSLSSRVPPTSATAANGVGPTWSAASSNGWSANPWANQSAGIGNLSERSSSASSRTCSSSSSSGHDGGFPMFGSSSGLCRSSTSSLADGQPGARLSASSGSSRHTSRRQDQSHFGRNNNGRRHLSRADWYHLTALD